MLAGKWTGALWASGLALVVFARWEDSDGSKIKLRQDATLDEWMLFFQTLEWAVKIGGLDRKISRASWRRVIAKRMYAMGAKLPASVVDILDKPEPPPRRKKAPAQQ